MEFCDIAPYIVSKPNVEDSLIKTFNFSEIFQKFCISTIYLRHLIMYFWCLKRNGVSKTFTFAHCHYGDGSSSEGKKIDTINSQLRIKNHASSRFLSFLIKFIILLYTRGEISVEH